MMPAPITDHQDTVSKHQEQIIAAANGKLGEQIIGAA
jgi:hypothetical protein